MGTSVEVYDRLSLSALYLLFSFRFFRDGWYTSLGLDLRILEVDKLNNGSLKTLLVPHLLPLDLAAEIGVIRSIFLEQQQNSKSNIQVTRSGGVC